MKKIILFNNKAKIELIRAISSSSISTHILDKITCFVNSTKMYDSHIKIELQRVTSDIKKEEFIEKLYHIVKSDPTMVFQLEDPIITITFKGHSRIKLITANKSPLEKILKIIQEQNQTNSSDFIVKILTLTTMCRIREQLQLEEQPNLSNSTQSDDLSSVDFHQQARPIHTTPSHMTHHTISPIDTNIDTKSILIREVVLTDTKLAFLPIFKNEKFSVDIYPDIINISFEDKLILTYNILHLHQLGNLEEINLIDFQDEHMYDINHFITNLKNLNRQFITHPIEKINFIKK